MKYIISLLIISLVGCHSMYGIRHHARLIEKPSIDCIENVLRTKAEIKDVKLSKEEGGRPLTFGGIEKANQIYRFSYLVGNLHGDFYFTENYKGEVEYTQTYLYMDAIPPQSEIDIILPVIIDIEQSLDNNCGFVNLIKKVERSCSASIKCI